MTQTSLSDAGRVSRPAEVRVWDPLVRLFHWSLVGAFLTAWASAEEWEGLHLWAGYTIAGLIVFRLVWGLVGPRHARFTDFVHRPSTVGAYVRGLFAGRSPRHLGHNPAGGAMIVLMLAMLSAICATGVMMTSDAFWGVEWVEHLHEAAVNAMLAFVVLHLGGVVFSSLRHRENLVAAMVTGRKRAPDAQAEGASRGRPH